MVAGGALTAIVIADVSGLSKAEVERIWLPFLPWLVVAAGAAFAERARGPAGVARRAGRVGAARAGGGVLAVVRGRVRVLVTGGAGFIGSHVVDA